MVRCGQLPDGASCSGGDDDEGRVVGVGGRVVDVKHEAAPAVRSARGTSDQHPYQVQMILVLCGKGCHIKLPLQFGKGLII